MSIPSVNIALHLSPFQCLDGMTVFGKSIICVADLAAAKALLEIPSSGGGGAPPYYYAQAADDDAVTSTPSDTATGLSIAADSGIYLIEGSARYYQNSATFAANQSFEAYLNDVASGGAGQLGFSWASVVALGTTQTRTFYVNFRAILNTADYPGVSPDIRINSVLSANPSVGTFTLNRFNLVATQVTVPPV